MLRPIQRCGWGLGLWLGVATISAEPALAGPEDLPGAAAPKSARKQDRTKECLRLIEQSRQLRSASRSGEAAATLQDAISLMIDMLGPTDSTVADYLTDLGQLHEVREDFPAARHSLQQALEIREKLHGKESWQACDLRRDLADVDRMAAWSLDQRRQLAEYRRLRELARRLNEQKLLSAAASVEKSLPICKKLFGDGHPEYANCLSNLGVLYVSANDLARGEPLLRQALVVRLKVLGTEHPASAESVRNLIDCLETRAQRAEAADDLAEARTVVTELIRLQTELRGKDHWRMADARRRLTDLERLSRLSPDVRAAWRREDNLCQDVVRLWKAGKFAEALPMAQRSVELSRQLNGEKHVRYGRSLFNLASQYDGLRNFEQAKSLYLQAQAIYQEELGRSHPQYLLIVHNLGVLAYRQGDSAGAIRLLERALKLCAEALGNDEAQTSQTRDALIQVHENRLAKYCDRGKYDDAVQVQTGLLELLIRLYGKDDDRIRNARRKLGELARLSRMSPEDRAALKNAEALSQKGYRLWQAGKYEEALPLETEVVAIYRKILGEHDPLYAAALFDLGAQHQGLREFDRAEDLYRQVLAIQQEQSGDTAHTLQQMLVLYLTRGDYRAAEQVRAQVEMHKPDKEDDSDVNALGNLTALHMARGEYARAEPLLQQFLERVLKRSPNSRKHAMALNQMAMFYEGMEDRVQAEPLLIQACIIARTHKEEDPLFAALLINNLACLYNYIGEFALAEPLHREALAIRKSVLGSNHPDCAQSLDNLGFMYSEMGKHDLAENYFAEAGAIYEQTVGKDHPDYAISRINMARSACRRQEFGRAEQFARQAIAAFEKTLGEQHPFWGNGVSALIEVCVLTGDATRAQALAQKRVVRAREHLEQTAPAQSERQQLVLEGLRRIALDDFLSVAILRRADADQVYTHVLAWKGAVFVRQKALREAQRLAENGGDATLRSRFAKLDDVSRRLAALAMAQPAAGGAASRLEQIATLSAELQHLEQEINTASEPFRKIGEQARVTPQRLREALPSDTALIDLIRYSRVRPSVEDKGQVDREEHLLAFLIRRDRPVEIINLGPIEPVAAAVEEWLERFGHPVREQDPGQALRRLLWEKWEDRLDGIKTVVISPDSFLGRLPFAALPGKEPKTFLLEERSIAVIPVPQLLPALLEAAPDKDAAEPSFLLVGDVAYGSTAEKGKHVAQFLPLPGTRGEIDALANYFRDVYPKARIRSLRGDEATEAAFRQYSPGCRWLHLATHGFYAPPRIESALVRDPELTAGQSAKDLFSRQGVGGFHPDLLSGLALAGANRGASANVPDGADDGILTALEVTALDLHGTELAVLSACETGLGATARGEGLLGLQRAFQMAGAGSVVGSLWHVDDRATQALMARFYRNLWSTSSPRSKLEALREAQLWMLREAPRHPELVRGWVDHLRGSEPELARGLEELPEPGSPRRHLPPYFWAAFVLSGDWR
jgi:CHAT domain-containing protein